jgi:hypothetical protein
MSLHKLYFSVLQIILIGGLVALHLNGLLLKPFESDSKWFCIALMGIWLYGMAAVFMQRWYTASWIAAILVRIGIVGMIVGVIGAVGAVASSVVGGDINAVLGAFLAHIGVALYASLVALASNLVLEANLFLLGADSEQE